MPIMNTVISGGGSSPTAYIGLETTNGVTKKGPICLKGVTNIGNHAFYNLFYSQSNSVPTTLITDTQSVVTVSGEQAFKGAFYDTQANVNCDFPSLQVVSGLEAFSSTYYNTGLTIINLPALQTVDATGAFYGAFSTTQVVSVSFPSLSSIKGRECFAYSFASCSLLTSVSFPALTSSSFGSYTNQFYNMLSNTSGVTVHFPASIQSVIGSWSDVTNGFGGTNTTVLFDL